MLATCCALGALAPYPLLVTPPLPRFSAIFCSNCDSVIERIWGTARASRLRKDRPSGAGRGEAKSEEASMLKKGPVLVEEWDWYTAQASISKQNPRKKMHY